MSHPQQPPAGRPIRAITNALRVLRLLANRSDVGLREIAEELGVSRTSAHHLMATLESAGMVARSSGGGYSLGWFSYELGASVARQHPVIPQARLHLDRLAVKTGEVTLLGIADARSVLYLDRGQLMPHFAMIANIGIRSPLHTNASGKALLAHMPQAVIESVLAGPLEAKTAFTVTDPRQLREDLEEVRSRGYAMCWREHEDHLGSLSSPVVGGSGNVVAALTVAAPTVRSSRQAMAELAPLVVSEASAFSRRLSTLDEPAERDL